MVAFKTVFAVLAAATTMVVGAPVEERDLAKRNSGRATYFSKYYLASIKDASCFSNKFVHVSDPAFFLRFSSRWKRRCLWQCQQRFFLRRRCQLRPVRQQQVRTERIYHQHCQWQEHHCQSCGHVSRLRKRIVSIVIAQADASSARTQLTRFFPFPNTGSTFPLVLSKLLATCLPAFSPSAGTTSRLAFKRGSPGS